MSKGLGNRKISTLSTIFTGLQWPKKKRKALTVATSVFSSLGGYLHCLVPVASSFAFGKKSRSRFRLHCLSSSCEMYRSLIALLVLVATSLAEDTILLRLEGGRGENSSPEISSESHEVYSLRGRFLKPAAKVRKHKSDKSSKSSSSSSSSRSSSKSDKYVNDWSWGSPKDSSSHDILYAYPSYSSSKSSKSNKSGKSSKSSKTPKREKFFKKFKKWKKRFTRRPKPTPNPTVSLAPSISLAPSEEPTRSNQPSSQPSTRPSTVSSSFPSLFPSLRPSTIPSSMSSRVPSSIPTVFSDSERPSAEPSLSKQPSRSAEPSLEPSGETATV